MIPPDLENLISELPPARQQAARRNLAKIAEENPQQYLLFELTLAKLANEKPTTNPTCADSKLALQLDQAVERMSQTKKDILGEVLQLRKELNRLNRVEEDARHIRICTDRTESKLDAIRPYRAKVALIVMVCVLATGLAGGWYGRIAYAKYQYEQYDRGR